MDYSLIVENSYSSVNAQFFLKKYVLGQVSMQVWAQYLFVENIDTYHGWLFKDNENFE